MPSADSCSEDETARLTCVFHDQVCKDGVPEPAFNRRVKNRHGKACQAHCPKFGVRLAVEAGPAPAGMNTVVPFDSTSAAFFLKASTALGFSTPRSAGACNGTIHQIRNHMKTRTHFPKHRWQLKPTPGAFSLPDCITGQAAQAVLKLAGDA